MRIETQSIQKQEASSLEFGHSCPPLRQIDSLQEFASKPSWLCRKFLAIWRSISNYFRGFFSSYLPINRRCPVAKNEIGYSKSAIPDMKGIYRYQVLVNGVSTDNEIKFTKRDQALYILEFTFPDEEMQEHIPSILEQMLKEEQATTFATEYLDRAKLLWSCGFVTDSKVSFNPDGTDASNKFIRVVLEIAQEKKDTLNEHYLDALKRLDKITHPSLWSFEMAESLLRSMVVVTNNVQIPLKDLLMVMEGLGMESRRGIRFANYEKAKPGEFTKGPLLELHDQLEKT
ncbi:MAG: hypothetical protein K1000chlam2_01717 [Chlamydiae bacterium]|nr:hypothetical protein [Chlamydiota bacterium]